MSATIILTAIAALAGLTILLALLLVVANKKLYVYEDPRIDVVEELLPSANCGACGQPGCRPFAEALVAGKEIPAHCTVSSEEDRLAIADYLGVDAGSAEKRVARLACAGGSNVARMRAEYDGTPTCRAAAQVAGGGKGCAWGCLGYGDCEKACDFKAIVMNEHSLPVVLEDPCTACGDCVEACPLDLFSIHPADHRLWVACKSLQEGDTVLEECAVGCNACGRCAADAPEGTVIMKNNLPVVDYAKNNLLTKDVIQRCPTGAIVWMDADKGAIRGESAVKILRKTPLPVEPAAEIKEKKIR